jgi:hypothetical protein
MAMHYSIADALREKALQIPEDFEYVDPRMPIGVFMNQLRSALQTAHKVTRYDKFSVRRSKCESYAIVMKTGTWDSLYKEMEQLGEVGGQQ